MGPVEEEEREEGRVEEVEAKEYGSVPEDGVTVTAQITCCLKCQY